VADNILAHMGVTMRCLWGVREYQEEVTKMYRIRVGGIDSQRAEVPV